MIELFPYETEDGRVPFAEWLADLPSNTAGRIRRTVDRMGDGNFGDSKGVGGGVMERRLDFGPGYRVYFGRDGERLVILLAGGTKRRQSADIELAKRNWADYQRRREERQPGDLPPAAEQGAETDE